MATKRAPLVRDTGKTRQMTQADVLALPGRLRLGNTSVSVPAADTLVLDGPVNQYRITVGSGQITYVNTAQAVVMDYGDFVILHLDAGITLVNNQFLSLPGAANIVTKADDYAVLFNEGGANWRVGLYQRADGTALAGASGGGDFKKDGSVAMTGALNEAPIQYVNAGSGSTADLGSILPSSNTIYLNATGNVTSLGSSLNNGARRLVNFQQACTLVHSNALYLPGLANIAVAVGDSAEFVCTGGGYWTCTMYTKVNGQAVVSGGADPTKEPIITPGTTDQYWRGDKTWVDFATTVRGSVLTGMVVTSNNAVVETDTLLVAIGKLQTQLNNKLASTGTAAAATKLATARNINGVAFDGTANITVVDSSAIPLTQRGAANGVATLDSGGLVPAAQLPSYVDDVLEYATFSAFPATGETGKIYICDTPYTQSGVTSSQFRWSGSAYVAIVASPGSTDSVTEGSTNLYFTVARVLASALTGLSVATSSAITATDTVLSGIGKLQAQITAAATALAANVRGTVLTGLSTATATAVLATDSVLAAIGKLQAQVTASVSPGYIDGFNLVWNSTTSVGVTSGSAWVPGSAKRVTSTATLTLSSLSGLTANSFYHLYLYDNSGNAAIELSATAPIGYFGSAYQKTGDATRRYLGTVLVNSSSVVTNFIQIDSRITYRAPMDATPRRVLIGGTATTAATVSLAGALPVTAQAAQIRTSPDTGVALRLSNKDITSASTGTGGGNNVTDGNYIFSGAPGSTAVLDFPVASDQTIMYWNTLTPTGSGVLIDVMGYLFSR